MYGEPDPFAVPRNLETHGTHPGQLGASGHEGGPGFPVVRAGGRCRGVVGAPCRRHALQRGERLSAAWRARIRLPYLELCTRFGLTQAQRMSLAFALMPEIDPKLLVAYRYLTGDPTCRSLDARLLA